MLLTVAAKIKTSGVKAFPGLPLLSERLIRMYHIFMKQIDQRLFGAKRVMLGSRDSATAAHIVLRQVSSISVTIVS